MRKLTQDRDGGLEGDEGEDAEEAEAVGFEPVLRGSDQKKEHAEM